MLIHEYELETGKIKHTFSRYGHFKCDICGNMYDRLLKKRLLRDFCSRKCVNKGRIHTTEHKKKISLSIMGDKNPFFGKHHSDKLKERWSLERKGKSFVEQYGFEKANLICQKISQNNKGDKNPFFGHKHSEESCQKMSKTRTQKIACGNISCGPRGRHGQYFSLKAGFVRFDSTFELIRMKILDIDSDVITWSKKHGIVIEYLFEDKIRHYVPDFRIETKDAIFIEEIKGYENPIKLQAKMKALEIFCFENGFCKVFQDFDTISIMANIFFDKTIAQLRKEWLNNS